jgi:hypothetical protein
MHVFTYVCQTCIQHGQYRVLLGPMQKKKSVPRYVYTRRGNADTACVQNMFGTNVECNQPFGFPPATVQNVTMLNGTRLYRCTGRLV